MKVFKKILNAFLLSLVIAILASTIYFISSYEYHPVIETSMMPTINNGDTLNGVYIEKTKEVEHGDVVVMRNGDKNIIKRVICLEGEGIGFYREGSGYNVLRLNNDDIEYLDEDYILSKEGNAKTKETLEKYISNGSIVMDSVTKEYEGQSVIFYMVNEGDVFVLGDNRAGSKDSSLYGGLRVDSIIGKAVYLTPRIDNEFVNGIVQFYYIMKKIVFFEGRNI